MRCVAVLQEGINTATTLQQHCNNTDCNNTDLHFGGIGGFFLGEHPQFLLLAVIEPGL